MKAGGGGRKACSRGRRWGGNAASGGRPPFWRPVDSTAVWRDSEALAPAAEHRCQGAQSPPVRLSPAVSALRGRARRHQGGGGHSRYRRDQPARASKRRSPRYSGLNKERGALCRRVRCRLGSKPRRRRDSIGDPDPLPAPHPVGHPFKVASCSLPAGGPGHYHGPRRQGADSRGREGSLGRTSRLPVSPWTTPAPAAWPRRLVGQGEQTGANCGPPGGSRPGGRQQPAGGGPKAGGARATPAGGDGWWLPGSGRHRATMNRTRALLCSGPGCAELYLLTAASWHPILQDAYPTPIRRMPWV